MQNYKTICICGGGSLGHTISATISRQGYQVNLLTGHPEKWSANILVSDCYGKQIHGSIRKISNKPEEVIPQADIILLCLPGNQIYNTLTAIAPYVNSRQEVGSVVCSSGFFWMARSILGNQHKLFGFQRVPYICRVKEYGKSAELKGYKSHLKIGGNEKSNLVALSAFFSEVFQTPTTVLKHYLEATLSNSNPILHPARIYGMLHTIETDLYDNEFLFYEEWNDYSSSILIACDNEFQQILSDLPIRKEEIPPLLEYYESTDEKSLTEKIRSIAAFKGIKMAMIPHKNKFKIDYTNRYFTEDIPYGLLIIKSLGVLLGKETPMIDRIISWTQEKMGKTYLLDGNLCGKDISESGIIQNYNITSPEALYKLN